MTGHIDMAQVEAALATSRAHLEPIAEGHGSVAAQARMSLAVDQAFGRQLAIEFNRCTDIELISDALAAVCVNMMRSLVDTVTPDDAPADLTRGLMERQLLKTQILLERNLSGDCEGPQFRVDATQGGHA